MRFIGEYWSAGHVLATSRRVMEWQHRGTDDRDFDYVVAFDDHEVLGVLGFILNSRYDESLGDFRTIWLALWKVRDDAPPGLGVRMLSFLENRISHEAIGSVGVRGNVVKLYKALGYQVGCMPQYYVLHPDYQEFSIAIVPFEAPRIAPGAKFDVQPGLRELSIDELHDLEDVLKATWPDDVIPRKSARFFSNRYVENPFYAYQVYAIERHGDPVGILVTRICEFENSRAIRIVDGFMPPSSLPGLGAALQDLLRDFRAEYADLYAFGLDREAFHGSGLMEVPNEKPGVVVPNYFEPFERRNVTLMWAYKLDSGQKIVSFKADADQDRPNREG